MITVDGKRIRVRSANSIPNVPFQFRGFADSTKELNDSDCKYLAQIETIDELNFGQSSVTLAGAAEFSRDNNVRSIGIPRLSNKPSEFAATFPKSRHVMAGYPLFPELTASMRGNPNVVSLRNYRVPMSVADCDNVVTMPNLKLLDADDTPFDAERIEAISKSKSIEHLVVGSIAPLEASTFAPLKKMKTLKSVRATSGSKEEQLAHAVAIKKFLPQLEVVDVVEFNLIREKLISYIPKPIDHQ